VKPKHRLQVSYGEARRLINCLRCAIGRHSPNVFVSKQLFTDKPKGIDSLCAHCGVQVSDRHTGTVMALLTWRAEAKVLGQEIKERIRYVDKQYKKSKIQSLNKSEE